MDNSERDRRSREALTASLSVAQDKLSHALADALTLFGSQHHVSRLIQHAQGIVADAERFTSETRPGVPREPRARRTDGLLDPLAE